MRKFKARRFYAMLALLGLAAFLFVVASPVSANHLGDGPPPASLLPDDDGITGDGTRLSDRFDGTDSAAHLTAIAANNITRVQWRACPTSVSETTPTITQADVTSCNVILGEDTTGALVGAGTVLVSPDKAFDVTVDFGVTLDTPGGAGAGDHDVLVLACVGAGEDVEGSDANCLPDVEELIFFDDASTGDPDTTAGEIISICTADTDAAGPDALGATEAANPCQYDTNSDGGIGSATDADTATERAAVDARFKPWKHGDPVPDNGFVIRATTSPDLNDSSELFAHIANPVGATQDPDAETGSDGCTVISALADRSTFECNLDNADTPASGTGLAVYIHNNGIGTGFCAAAHCTLDSHGSIAVTRAPTTAVIHLGPTSTTSNCGVSPKTAETVTADQVGDVAENVDGCFLDQFGQLIAADFAFGIAPVDTNAAAADPSGFLGAEGTETDSNTDFFFEAVKGVLADMAGDAIADQSVELEVAQAYTITFCRDLNTDGLCGTTDLPAKTAVKTVLGGAAEQVTLVFRSRTPTAPTRTECLNGPTSAQNNVGDRDNLLACVFDAFLNQQNTGVTGDIVRLDWTIAPAGGGEVTTTRFPSGSPAPSESDASGFATAVIEAFCRDVNNDGLCDQGNDIITVTLREADGTVEANNSSSVQKRVTGGAPPPSGQPGKCPGFESSTANQIVGTAASETLNGTTGDDIICGLGGNDVINGLSGNDTLLGGDGNDTIRGGAGADVIFGQVGNDLIFGNEGADRVSGGDGADRINLGAGNDRGWGGGGEDRIWGLAGSDVIYGNTGDDPNLRGGDGNDFLVGGSGSDGLVGEQGSDKGWGQSGDDRLYFRDAASDARVDGGGGIDICSIDAGLDLVVANCP